MHNDMKNLNRYKNNIKMFHTKQYFSLNNQMIKICVFFYENQKIKKK